MHRLLAQDEDIEGIVVVGVGLWNEAVIRGIEHRRMDDAIHSQEAAGFVQLVFHIGAQGDFDDGLKIAREIVAGGNVVPSMEH